MTLDSRQGERAESLIKTGKENGVYNFEITVDKKVGLNFGANIKGVSINSMFGSDGKMTLKVQYK